MNKYMPKFYTLEDMTQEDLNKLALERNTFAREIEQLNNIIKNVKDTISFICYNSERPLTMRELNKLYNLLDGASKK